MGRGSPAAFCVLAGNANVGCSVLPDIFVKDGAETVQIVPPWNDRFIFLMCLTVSNSHGDFSDIYTFASDPQIFILHKREKI